MALTDDNMVMPVSPYGNMGGGFGGDSWAWIILLLMLGWGNNGWGGNDNNLYPWMNQADITTSGFQNAQLGNQLTATQADLGDIQTQLCNGFAGVNQNVSNGFASTTVKCG